MSLPIKRIGSTPDEPVTLAQMKTHLNVGADFTDDDELIAAMISAAREDAEGVTGRSYCSGQWLYALDFFPIYFANNWTAPARPGMDALLSYNTGTFRNQHSQIITIPFPPLVSIDSVVYAATDGTWPTISPLLYQVDAISEPGRICPAPGAVWPAVAPVLNAVQITFTSGYGTVPYRVQQLIRLRAATYYANREEFVAGTPSARPEWFERGLSLEQGAQMLGFVGQQ